MKRGEGGPGRTCPRARRPVPPVGLRGARHAVPAPPVAGRQRTGRCFGWGVGVFWAKLRATLCRSLSPALLERLRMRMIVSLLGLLLLMGSFGTARQQQYDSDARRFTVQGEPNHATTVGPVLAAQKLPAEGTAMEMGQHVSIPEMTEAISARLAAQWEGWKNQDPAPNDAIIADDFHSFWPDGSRHLGRPT